MWGGFELRQLGDIQARTPRASQGGLRPWEISAPFFSEWETHPTQMIPLSSLWIPRSPLSHVVNGNASWVELMPLLEREHPIFWFCVLNLDTPLAVFCRAVGCPLLRACHAMGNHAKKREWSVSKMERATAQLQRGQKNIFSWEQNVCTFPNR